MTSKIYCLSATLIACITYTIEQITSKTFKGQQCIGSTSTYNTKQKINKIATYTTEQKTSKITSNCPANHCPKSLYY